MELISQNLGLKWARHLYINLSYTVQKGQCNFKLRKHDTYHLMAISTLCNVKLGDISANVE
jgi:hypothetical protein